jgi:threonine synthase
MAEYFDPRSGARYPLDVPRWRGDDGAPLLVTPGHGLAPDEIETHVRSLWRYRAAFADEIADPITLGEGCTPLLQTKVGPWRPFFKCEWVNPTGSFKDRGASLMLSFLRQIGVVSVLEDSSGNGGSAMRRRRRQGQGAGARLDLAGQDRAGARLWRRGRTC